MSSISSGEVLVAGEGLSAAELERWPITARVDSDVMVVRADLAELPEIARYAKLAIGRSPDGSTRVLGDEACSRNSKRVPGCSSKPGGSGRLPSPTAREKESPGIHPASRRRDLPTLDRSVTYCH
jgi:hypothetical protein